MKKHIVVVLFLSVAITAISSCKKKDCSVQKPFTGAYSVTDSVFHTDTSSATEILTNVKITVGTDDNCGFTFSDFPDAGVQLFSPADTANIQFPTTIILNKGTFVGGYGYMRNDSLWLSIRHITAGSNDTTTHHAVGKKI